MSCGCNKNNTKYDLGEIVDNNFEKKISLELLDDEDDLEKMIDDDFENNLPMTLNSPDDEYIDIIEENNLINELKKEGIEFDKTINKEYYDSDENSIENILKGVNFNDDNLIYEEEINDFIDFIPINEYTVPIYKKN